jgi:hypothetical protein
VHSRRIAAFLLGAWICGSLLLGLVGIRNYHFPGELLAAPIDPAAKLINDIGYPQARLLLQHFAAEQNRTYFYLWEQIEIPLALLLGLSLFLATQRRIPPLVLCGIMLFVVLFQYFAITPELAYSGRGTDFPPLSEAFGAQARIWTLTQVYIGMEIFKLGVGVILAGYIFVFRPHRPNRRRTDTEVRARPAPMELRDF